MFCKHKWELLSETTTESSFEHAMKVLGCHGQIVSNTTIPRQMACTERKHIQVFVCECGKMKRYVEEIW